MSRLNKTLADYLVIAVSPALVMALIGSLIFFLLSIFYDGAYSERVYLVFALFIFAAVLIARIAIELGADRAMMYAAPLALVTALALTSFLDASLLVVLILIGLIWWSAHKLTIDCTLIDESQDASGEGLLEVAGLVKRPGGQAPPAEPEKPPEGLISRDLSQRPWWERLRDPPKRPHAPGVWIVYFSLVALPLFGICQRFIPPADTARRAHAFEMICTYSASALGLLLTTSFLGLRRYLRQRKLQMPARMAGSWITIGCALIVALLGFAALLPRPGAEYAAAELPLKIFSPSREASRSAVGDQSADKNTAGASPGKKEASEADQDQGTPPPGDAKKGPKSAGGKEGSKTSRQGDAKQVPDKGGQSKGGQSKGDSPKGEPAQKAPQDDPSPRSDETREKSDRGPGEKSDEQGEKKSDRGGAEGQTKRDRPGQTPSGGSAEEKDRSKEPKSPGSGSRPSTPPKTPSAPRLPLEWTGGSLAAILKWLFYVVLIALGVYALWRARAEVGGAFRQLLAAWREFWAWLFGRPSAAGQTAAAAEAQRPASPSRRLADFVDPFAAGTTDRFSPDELVRYSFEALEAWGRESGSPRQPDQTAHEFAQRVGDLAEPLARDARMLADLYCRVAYAPGTLPRTSLRPLQAFWRNLRIEAPRRESPALPANP
jgi:hypothetical protein